MEDTEKADSESIPKSGDASPSQGKSCALCGCATPAVRCDRCNSQMFCLSCDDMYHRHPKRKLHLRKAVDSIWSTARSPRLRRRTDLPGDPCKIPIPPPRTKKRERHTIGGRIFLKSGLELGSFGHSKVFDPKNLMPSPKDYFAGQKSPVSLGESNLDEDASNQLMRNQKGQIYENDNVPNSGGDIEGNVDDRSPWNATRPNISSPIQVSIPSNSPDIVANGQSFGYPTKPHSQSAADLSGHTGHPPGHHPYHFHPPYQYMHPPMHPYSHSMAHLNCAQCLSSSWSNLMSPHPSPYFHPMPWGSAQNTMQRHPVPGQLKHSHGDLASYPDSNFHYPYPGGGYYHNGPPVVDPNFIKDLHEQAEMQKLKKEVPASRHNPDSVEMDTAMESIPTDGEPADMSEAAPSSDAGASARKDVQQEEEVPAAPEIPNEPWSCAHCTFINPAGIHICQICCKTSYGKKRSKGDEDANEMRPRSRDSESPLINRDALLNSPSFSELKEAQKDADVQMESPFPESELSDKKLFAKISEAAAMLTTETQTSTSTKTTDVQTQNVYCKSMASSTDSIFPKQEISVQTEVETVAQNCSVATDPMISSQSLESLLSGVSAPPYHNRRAGWGRGASFSTQSLYERGRSRSPMPRSLSMYNEAQNLGRDPNFPSEEAMHSVSQAWLYTDPMYYKPHNQGLEQALTKEDYFDGTWGSMDRLNRRVKHKKDKGKVESVRPKFHRSLDDLKSDKRPEMIHTQELMMLQTVKEAERCGFSLEDLHVAYLHCGKENPVYWLEDNWSSMIKNVIALAAKYGEDNEENDVGVITSTEAKDALRIHRGDIWDAVTECIENRQRKILELTVRGNFTQKQIVETLKNNEGNIELAYADLVRASTRRHKFILSPGLSEDSEDLNLYNPNEDSSADHHVGLSHQKAVRADVSVESKIEKKKSDFLTKLSAIRTAQSERRKAREEKELIRETISQDYPVSESEVSSKDKDITAEIPVSSSREDSKEVEENIQDIVIQSPTEEVEVEIKSAAETPELHKNVTNIKEGTEDSIPIDFDTNWSESQGEWIEEYSDEQWEDDSQWVGLGKKFQKMEKEFEEEAMQMAALWEKEELEDDVFEDEAKELKTEAEIVPDSDRKFDEWVKANLKDSFEYEEEDAKEKALKEASLVDSIELETSRPSPLQHYPTTHDLSQKSHFDSDWVDLPADAEIEKLAHDIVCEGSDIENKFDEEEMMQYEEERKLSKLNDQEGSDEDWEKIEMDEQQLQDVNELDQFAFPDKEGDIEKNIEELDQALMENIIDERDNELAFDNASEIKIREDSKILYKNLENIASEDTFVLPPTKESFLEVPVSDTVEISPREELPFIDGDQPKPPVRRKSKLNSAAIEEALKNHAEISADIPPVLPEKIKNKESKPNVSDLYSMPDKATKVNQELVSKESERSVPQKPPRLNLSPEVSIQKGKDEYEPEVPPKRIVSKDASPVTSLSNESDSNCFADSESDTEIKLRRQKNIHRKPPKYENEIEDAEIENISKTKLDKMIFDEKSDVLESNLDFELDDDIDPALIEPLPPMKSIDFDPELPILLGGRGSRLADLDDVDAPKAFREDTTRPLQLFKATKRETPTNTLSRSTPTAAGFETLNTDFSIEQQVDETSFIMRSKDELPAPSLELASGSRMPVFENLHGNADVIQDSPQFPVSSVYENQASDGYYYNETMRTQPDAAERLPEKWEAEPLAPEKLVSEVVFEQNIEQVVEPVSTVDEETEIGLSEMEGMSAAVDYFFGRYNEITVTRPKKKTPVRAKPTGSPSPKPMSTSEIAAVKSEVSSEMEKSAAAVLETHENLQSIPGSDLKASVSNQVLQQKGAQAVSASVTSREMPTAVDKVKEPAPSEYLPFAEDYLFGCYNEVVVVPRKKKTIALAQIPKLGASIAKTQNILKEQKPPVQPVVLPEPVEPVEELSKDENVIPSETSSLIYDEVFHDLPSDILLNQSFDDGGSIYYESFQDAVEEIQDTSSVAGSVVNVKAKAVHFEDPGVPVVPPRRIKAQPGQKPISTSSTTTSESNADEYLFRQYEQVSQAKKKLPVCSEDFRMKQGFEPTEIPCDTPLLPDEQQEGVISSEISVETPPKPIDSLKNNLEYDFGDSEQSLDSVKHEVIESGIDSASSSTEYQIGVSVAKDSSVSDGYSVAIKELASDVREGNIIQTSDIQISENAESFEELSLPDQPEDITESPVVSSEMYLTEESKIISDDLTSDTLKSSLNNMQPPRPCKPKPYDQCSYPSVSSRLEMDQFVFIEQTQDIIDDSYTLYDIQESLQSSLACDLNYVDVKNNIEDECTDDSEKEWKRNEDIKNSLNASFLSTTSDKREFDDQVETILDVSEKSSLDVSKDHYSEVDEFKKEELNLDDGENKISLDKNYLEGLESPIDVTETCTSEQSSYIVINSQTGERSVDQLSAELSEDITDYESKDSFSVDENLVVSESVMPYSLEKWTTLEETVECSSEILQETVGSVIQPLSVLCQAVTEVSNTSDSSVITEDISIMKEDTLQFSEEVLTDKVHQEEEIFITEDQEVDILEDLEASGELSDNGNDLSDDSLAPSTHSSVSTQIAVSMKFGLKEPEPDESSLFEFSENLENDNEVPVMVSFPASTIAEKLPSDEETSPLEHVSKSGDTPSYELTSQTVSTTDSALKEEYERESKGFEYGENIEVDMEQAMSEGDKFTPTPPLDSQSDTILSRYSPEIDLDVSVSAVSHTVKEGPELCFKEPDLGHEKSFKSPSDESSSVETTDKIAVEYESEDILQNLDAESIDEVVSEPSGYASIFDVYEIKDNITFVSEDVIEEVIDANSNASEYSQIKEKETEINQGFVHSESILSEDTQFSNTEIKLSEPESIETTTTDSLFDEENAEEPSLSVMSHFYDEWYHNVEPSSQFTLLSTDSIYAKYGAAESSESGNESGEDNIVSFKLSEDIMQEDKVSPREDLVDQIISKDQIKDMDRIMTASSESEKNNFIDEVKLQNITVETDFENISNQTSLLHTISKEKGQEMVENQEISEEKITEESNAISDFMSYDKERAETVTHISENQEAALSIKEKDTSDTKLVESKFSTSKSCQTEDSFEEEIFFDSFDDTFTIPSYIHLPIEEVQTKPSTSDISVQCELISTEAITVKVASTSEIQATSAASHAPATPQDFPKQPKLSEEILKKPDDDKDESSCESFEESDSDIFIESHSSHDEFEVPSSKKGFLYAEIDSDTGFSSGSECGWTRSQEKQLKGKKTLESSVTEVQLQKISSTTLSGEKEISGSVQTFVVESSLENTMVKSQIAEAMNISEKGMVSGNIEGEIGQIDSEISDAKVYPFPPEIIERAVTPVAVPQFPSFEEDLVFVEVEESVEEAAEGVKEEVVSTTPTVEYFYGRLPETVKIESPSDINDRFFETASELSESLSFPLDTAESFSDSSVSFSEKMPKVLSGIGRDTDILEEESFADTYSSFKAEDSISEYYALPESVTSGSKSENFILTENEQSEVLSNKAMTIVACDTDTKGDDLESSDFIADVEHVHVDNITQEIKSLEISESKTSESRDNQNIMHESKEAMVKSHVSKHVDAPVISSELELKTELRHKVLSKKEIPSEEMTVSVGSQEILCKAENVEIDDVKVFADSGSVVFAEDSKSWVPISDATVVSHSEYESVTPIKPSADVPPAPSDIIRYLYYDDSITFDDDSYHTQSEMVEFPPLPADELAPSETAVVKAETLLDTALLEKSTDKVCTTPSIQPETESDSNMISESVQRFVGEEPIVQESSELQKMLEESIPEEIFIPPVSELKLATVEIIKAENVTELPSGQQIPESVQNIVSVDENVPEPALSKDASVLPLDTESQDLYPKELKKTSPEVPQVPSDIVRYLYYGDDITFEESNDITFDDTSFHSQSDNDALGFPSDDKMLQHSDNDIPEISDLDIGSAENLELMEELDITGEKLPELSENNKMKFLPEMKNDSCEDSSYKHSSSVGEVSLPPLDNSECVDKWFDMAEKSASSVNGKKERPVDSDQHSSTKSSAFKDSEQPCIPEYILSPIPEGNLPATKTDIDEVTDISTHFTMTDDSDKFSDIESDTSLNFEEECILPFEIEPIEIENAVLFESSIDDDDEMNLPTPEVKCLPGGFQFPTPELSGHTGEFVDKSVEPIEQQEEFDECVTSTEFSEQYKEQFSECLTSSEVLGQQPSEEADLSNAALEHSDNQLKEFFESGVLTDASEEHFTEPLTSSEHHNKEATFYDIAQDHTDQEFKEFHECNNLNEFSECLTSSEQHSKELVLPEVHLNEELKEKNDEPASSVDISEHFTECMTSSELLSEEMVYEIPKENVDELFEEQPSEYLIVDLRDENGNIPESISTSSDFPVACIEMAITTEKLEYQLEITESTSVDREDETELSCYTSPIVKANDESSCPVIEEEIIHVSTEDSVAISQVHEPECISLDKDEDIDVSCYTAPNEDSVFNEEDSISTEMTDNWDDAECKNIEIDESIYDLPLEEMNYIQPEVSNQDAVILTDESYFDKSFESVSYKVKAIESEKCDTDSYEVEKADIPQIETVILPLADETKSDINAKPVELSDKFIHLSKDEKAVSIEKDSCQILEEREASLKIGEHQIAQSKVKESPDNSTILTQILPPEKCLETSSDFNKSLLSSDMKNISEVKMETESEMRTAVQEEVNIECVSAVSGTEPKFLLGGTMHDTLEVELEEASSKELSGVERVITSGVSAVDEIEDSLGYKNIIDPVTETRKLSGDAKVLESSLLKDVDLRDTDSKVIPLDSYDILPKNENIATDTTREDKVVCESLILEKEPECITLTTQSEIVELLEASDNYSAECIAAVTSESAVFENISPVVKKIIYEEPHLKEVLKVESTEISAETEIELSLEKCDDVDKNNLVDDVDFSLRKVQISESEFSADSCDMDTVVVLKKQDDILDKGADADSDKKFIVDDVDSLLKKSKAPDEFETFNFKGEFSVESCEKETVDVLEESVFILDEESHVDDVGSQITKLETSDKLETVYFKGEFAVDSCEKEIEVVLRKPGDIPDKETDADSDKKILVGDTDFKLKKPEASDKLETFNFRGEFSVDSCEKETVFVLKEPTDSAADNDFITSKTSDLKMESPDTEITEKVVFKTEEYKDDVNSKVSEVVDFKMLSGGTDFKGDKINEVKLIEMKDESVDFKLQITTGEEKITGFIKQSSRTCDVDFEDITIKDISHKITEPPEIVDFKGQGVSVDSEKFKREEHSRVTKESTESRFTYDDKCIVSNNKIILSERVDFKGEIGAISAPIAFREEGISFTSQDTYKMLPTIEEQKLKMESSGHSLDVVDFRGQIVSGDLEIKMEKKDVLPENIDYSKYEKGNKTFVLSDDSNVRLKTHDSIDIVDFKGQVINSDELCERKTEDAFVSVKDTAICTEEKDSVKAEELFAVVDFKGSIIADSDSQEKEVTLKHKYIHPLEDKKEIEDISVLKNDAMEEITDFRGNICSDVKVLDSKTDIFTESIDTSHLLCKDETVKMDTAKNLHDSHEEGITFESHGKVYHEQNVTTYEASVEESSELYSCVETLSTTDTSMQFYSLSDDLDDTLNATSSEDFTDVPSHFTSTEDSDKWSDVEGDLSMDDEFNRDRTPTRTEIESIGIEETTMTKSIEHKTSVQEETSKPDSTPQEISLESFECSGVDKSTGKETFVKREGSIAESAIDVVLSEKIISESELKNSDVISYPESYDFLTATGTMNFTERDIQQRDVGYVTKDLLQKQDIVESKENDSSQSEASEMLVTSVDEATAELFIAPRKSEEDTQKIVESLEDVTKFSQIEDVKKPIEASLKVSSKSDDLVLKDIGAEEISHKILESSASVDFKGCDLIESSVSHEVLSDSLMITESVEDHYSSLDSKESYTDRVVVIPSAENTELPPTDKSSDLSMSTSIADYTDVSTYQLSTDSPEKWSDVESEMHFEDLTVDFKGSLETGTKSSKEMSKAYSNQTIYSDTMNSDMQPKRDLSSEIEKDSTAEEPLMEHFAAIKSLNESLTVANTFSSFDAETAVSKTHEDSTDISSQFEKTESECWLEVATDNSVSEFAEDVVLSAERDEKEQVGFSEEIIADQVDTSVPYKLHSEMTYTSTMPTSSSYTDLDNLDLTSDTRADISLQGATTESSDRWSDIEAEALIDDVLYGGSGLTENVESVDFTQSIKQLDEKKEKEETSLPECQLLLSSVESREVCASSASKIISKSEPLAKVSPERKIESLKATSLSFEGSDSLSINLTDSGQSSIPTESQFSSILSSPSNVTTTVMSDDDFTNVTPLDVTTEESDKWSDISGDSSVEEIEEDSSVSLKASLKLQELEPGAVLSEFKVGLPVKEPDSLAGEESESFNVKLSKIEDDVKETATQDSISEKKEILFDFQKQQDSMKTQEEAEVIFKLSESVISQKSTEKIDSQSSEIQRHEMERIPDYSSKVESKTESELASTEKGNQTDTNVKLKSEEVTIDNSQLKQKIQMEDDLESKVTDESETLDTYTDIPTHTFSPETSEAYCELESDHSIEDIMSQPGEDIETQHIQQIENISRQTISECYENSLTTEELVEDADEYGLDTIPENELENYEEEEYSLSEHFEINEDELIYPLPYNDWIEQSFDLKEYGIEAAFSESGSDIHGLGLASDIHGLGIANEEYDDEDIQRAIDFNISNFEDEGENNFENVGMTESFKTLSNDVSPHLKHSDKEFDSWSTADAPSIEEEEDFVEHDNILSKIDELLAEDFGDLDEYETVSPLTHEQDTEDYFFKQISTPDYLHSEDYAETSKINLPEETSLDIEESEKAIDSRIISGEEALRKDSKTSNSVTCDVTFQTGNKIFKPESVSSEVTVQKDFKISEPESLSEEVTSKKDSKISESDVVSSKFCLKKDSKISDSETAVARISQKKDSKSSESELLASQIAVKKDSELSEFETETVSSKFSLKNDSKTSDSKISQNKDSKASESDLSASKITLKDSVLSQPEAETVSSKFSLKKDSKIPDFETVTNKLPLKKDSILPEHDSVSNEMTLQNDSKISETVSVSDRETVSSKFSVMKDSKLSEPETVSSKVTLEKDYKTFETVSEEITLVKDSKTVSSKVSLKKDSKESESDNVLSQVSIEQTSKTSSSKEEKVPVILEDETKVAKSMFKESLSSLDEASQLLSLDESKTKKETTQAVSLKAVQASDVETEVSVKLKSSIESAVVDRGKDFMSTSDEASASIILFSKDSQIKDQLADSITLPAPEANSSFDIPSKQLNTYPTASAAECTIKETTRLSEKIETIQSSQLSGSSKLVLTSESNIPDSKLQDTLSEKSFSGTLTTISKEQTSTDSVIGEVKPDIPRKVKRKSLDTREVMQKESIEKKPSLPPKLSKRHSTSDSSSSSVSESLSSSSSIESIGSFESAISERSRKSLKSSEDTSYHSESPEVPARRSRSLKESSSRSRSRDSEDSSLSSSLRIRRRSSNFKEPEPTDLSKKRASIDERMQKLQNEGKCATKEKAFIAAKLIEMQFEEEDALLASRQCNTVYNAVKFLTQLCELCNCRFPINLMTSMVHCTHRACKECLKAHFTSLIYDRSVFALLCPVCQKPDITDQNIQEYFNHLDMMLRRILEDRVYDLFQRKLRDEVLTKDPNFHWCSQCSSGFIASPRLKKLYCPDCSAITCALCHQTWELEHEGVHCERFQQWKDMHTPEPPPAGLVKFLTDRGVSCPSCGIVYAQACGGCMMYKCSHCSFEFCGFCIQPLKRGRDCSDKICETRGLHIHHVHNCLFYIRDKDISEIQMLLEEESVTYLTIPPKDQIVKSRCQVREQKHAHGVITEDRCGRDIEPYCGGLCRTHYYEYLSELLRQNAISPLSIMTIQDLQSMLRKSRVLVPERMKGEKSEDFYERLLKLITSALT